MTSGELQVILHSLRSGAFAVSCHAAKRMRERGVHRDDICNVADTAFHTTHEEGRWVIEGEDLVGDVLVVICTYDGETIIVTVKGS